MQYPRRLEWSTAPPSGTKSLAIRPRRDHHLVNKPPPSQRTSPKSTVKSAVPMKINVLWQAMLWSYPQRFRRNLRLPSSGQSSDMSRRLIASRLHGVISLKDTMPITVFTKPVTKNHFRIFRLPHLPQLSPSAFLILHKFSSCFLRFINCIIKTHCSVPLCLWTW